MYKKKKIVKQCQKSYFLNFKGFEVPTLPSTPIEKWALPYAVDLYLILFPTLFEV